MHALESENLMETDLVGELSVDRGILECIGQIIYGTSNWLRELLYVC